MFVEIASLGPGSGAPRELLVAALAPRAGDVTSVEVWADHLATDVATGAVEGRRVRFPSGAAGVALWDRGSPLGASVRVLYVEPPAPSMNTYGALLDLVEREAGRVVFAPGRLAGLSEREEATLLAGRGFAPYGRSELRLPASRAVPDEVPPRLGHLREVRAGDEPALAALHLRAYRASFDRYLFLEDPDETRDAAREVGDLVGGRWGPLERPGSVLLEEGGRAIAAVIAVRRPDGVLLADVEVDPDRRGLGLGRSVLVASLRGLRRDGPQPVYLNVTEGNAPALALYASVGFVRSLGPSRDWYATAIIPVRP